MADELTLSVQVATEIKVALARRDMSRSELARRLGVSAMWVSDRLRGQTPIGLDDLERIAGVLEVKPVELLPLSERGGPQTTRLYSPMAERPMSPRPSRGPVGAPHNTHPTGGQGVRRSRRLGTPAAVAEVANAT